jgi:hypothetical protein
VTGQHILVRRSPPKPTKVYDTYWRFAAERQEIFFRRFHGSPPPWTDDLILRAHKFTNAYRASDRVSQFLIKEVIYSGDQSVNEVLFRCILFKIFNRESTWRLLIDAAGDLCCSPSTLTKCCEVLDRAMLERHRIFSAAYIMPTHAKDFDHRVKHRNYSALLGKMIADELPKRLAESKSMADAFQLFRSYPLIGDFLAYQFVTDINYSSVTEFSEMEFVMPGPGAKDGIRKCFESLGDYSETDVIRLAAERQNDEFSRLGLSFRSLWGRPLQLIDCQNLFCEIDKYSRRAHPEIRGISGRTRIKQKFTANSQAIQHWYPPKWGINGRIESSRLPLQPWRIV